MKKEVIVDKNFDGSFSRFIRNPFSRWLLYMICYAIVLISVSCLFHKTFVIDFSYYGLYAFVAAIIISILNQTIKPVLFYLTLPITALTFGLFYPILNVFILYITSCILGSHFEIHGVIMPFVIAILISVLNFFMEGIVIKPIINKGR